MFEGWIWRKYQFTWLQRFALIYEGVLYFFDTRDLAEKFKLLAARDEDSVFLASQVSEGVYFFCFFFFFLALFRS